LKRKFEMYQYRQVLVRMRQGDSDRYIDRSKIMGRKKMAAVREIATERGWLSPGSALPDDAQLATAFSRMRSTNDAPQSKVAERVRFGSDAGQRRSAGIFQGSNA
jgi:hypothetical protein